MEQYTVCQQKTLYFLDKQLENAELLGGIHYCKIIGSAGTGKTFICAKWIEKLNFNIYKVACVAPTRKALSILKQKISYKRNLRFLTLHSLLNFKCDYDINGKMKFISSSDKINLDFNIIFIDESSMISIEIYKYLTEKIVLEKNKKHCLIIFMGDICQLPPVNENVSRSLLENYEMINLKEIIRSKNELISQMYKIWRKNVIHDINKKYKLSIKNNNNVLYFRKNEDFKIILCKNITNFINKNQNSIVLSYSNKSVSVYNNLIRNYLFGKDAKNPFCPGEKLIVNNGLIYGFKNEFPIFDKKNNRYVTNDFININLVTIVEMDMPELEYNNIKYNFPKMKTWMLTNDKSDNFFIIHKDSKHDWNLLKKKWRDIINCLKDQYHSLKKDSDNLKKIGKSVEEQRKEIKKECKILKLEIKDWWKLFIYMQNSYNAPLIYAYSLTVHKSQGSTFQNVFVDAKNIKICTKKNISLQRRCLYTAVSRASDSMVMLI